MTDKDGTPAVTSGEDPAPTPSADRGTSEPTTLQDHVQQEMERRFGSSPGADDVGDPEPSSPDPEAAAPEEAPPASPEPEEAAPGAESDDNRDLSPDHPDAQVEGKPEESEAQPGAETPAEDDEGEADLSDEVSEEELKAQHPRTQKRMRKLLQQRAELRDEVERSKPVMGFIDEHKLQGDDVSLALGMTAALQRGDFKGFLEGVMPLVQAAQQYLGTALSPELQQQVNQGYITQELAQQMQAAQSQAAWNAEQSRKQQEQRKAEDTARQSAELQRVLQGAVAKWESTIRSSDPDYAQKEPAILRATQALVAERGQPRTAEDAVQIAKDAYAEVNAMLTKMVPQPVPQETRRTPSSGISSRSAEPAPSSMLEAVKRGLRNAHSA